MILTGDEIRVEVEAGRIVIEPFDPRFLEPNSYGFHLASTLLVYTDDVIDSFAPKGVQELEIPASGLVLERSRFYLGSTLERMGSTHHAAHLYARLSTGSCGIFLQTSAPLGHTGAIIPWTLELVVAHNVRVYPEMLIGKICFWQSQGAIESYQGRYRSSSTVVHSLLSHHDP